MLALLSIALACLLFPVAAAQEDTPECPQDVSADASAEGIRLSWSPSEGADGYRIYRYTAAWEYILLGETSATSFTDDTAAAGQTYSYRVRAFNEAGESIGCESAEATAVPFFGAPLLTALALAGSLGAFAWMRRR